MISQSLLDKLKKLSVMSDRGTPHEAAIAAERMQALLQEHNLSRSDIESRSSDELPASATRERAEQSQGALYRWQRDLMETIAENNFCMHWVASRKVRDPKGATWMWSELDQTDIKARKVKRHVLIGRSENVAATTLMYDYLVNCMNNLMPFVGKERGSASAKLWIEGCAETLCERLTAQRTGRVKEEQQQTSGLLRLSDLYGNESDLNEDFRRNLEPGTTARERREKEAERLEFKRKEAELVAQGADADDAYYLARGYEVPDRSPQKIEKSYSRSNGGGRIASGWTRKDQAQWDRRNSSSFKQGKQRGHDIGLGGALRKGDVKELA